MSDTSETTIQSGTIVKMPTNESYYGASAGAQAIVLKPVKHWWMVHTIAGDTYLMRAADLRPWDGEGTLDLPDWFKAQKEQTT